MIDEKIGYSFKNKVLLCTALTHPSKSKENYQRLEFLGDSILGFLVGEYLFEHSKKHEGELTVLRSHYVSEKHLSECFDELGLSDDVVMGKSMNGEITPAIKGDIVEAIIAAIYLDSDMEKARKFVIEKLHIEEFENAKNDNYKSQLQELIQANFKCSMRYEMMKVDDNFEAKFFMDDDHIATGFGKDKTSAEQNCAYVALSKLFVEEE